MPRVSKKREVDKEKQKLFIDDFYSAVTSLKDKDEVREFFEDLLTTEEKLMLAKRFQAAMMLNLDYLWDEIDERIKVTRSTIAGVYQNTKFGFGGLGRVAGRIVELKKKKKAEIVKRFEKVQKGNLAPTLVQAGIGLLIQEKRRLRKQKSVIS